MVYNVGAWTEPKGERPSVPRSLRQPSRMRSVRACASGAVRSARKRRTVTRWWSPALAAGITKEEIRILTGLGRTTIDRIEKGARDA